MTCATLHTERLTLGPATMAHFEAFVEGYLAAGGQLGANWRENIPAHQLHPLAVHAYTHGPSYGDALVRAAESVLGA